jgi:hypothetical protein
LVTSPFDVVLLQRALLEVDLARLPHQALLPVLLLRDDDLERLALLADDVVPEPWAVLGIPMATQAGAVGSVR